MGWNKTKTQENMHFHSIVWEENDVQLQQQTLKNSKQKKKKSMQSPPAHKEHA